MKYIYQIGRVDRNILESKKFKIGDKIYEYPLSGIALKKYFLDSNQEEKTNLIIVYPVSLALNKSVSGEKNFGEFARKIENIINGGFENLLSNPQDIFSPHPHNSFADGFFVIHSIGGYEGKIFNAKFDFIVLEFFCDMVKKYLCWEKLNENLFELFVDISTGLNIYVSAMVEAARYFIVFQKLRSWIKEKSANVKICFSEPIIGSSSDVFNIYFDYTLDVKVFLSSPIRKNELNFVLARKIATTEQDKELKQRLNKVLENFALLFSSFKNTTPLVWYSFEFDNLFEIYKFEQQLIDRCSEIFSSNWQNAENIEVKEYFKVFFAVSFYIGLLRVLEKEKIIQQKEVTLDDLEKSKDILKSLGIDNLELLGNELRNLSNFEKKKEKFNNATEWQPMKNFIPGETEQFNV
ncbi:MAG: CRISPR-associated CARF protein Csx1, partial [Elusimicrobiota bacterium]|nr:CRISPR-associated CARF protein Csx1 [Elusimicrobiota bacterium]